MINLMIRNVPMKLLEAAFMAFLFACLSGGQALAAAAPAKSASKPKTSSKIINLSEKDLEDIQQAEEYIRNLKSARARFVQTTHDGTQLVGTFYLQRPGKLRFEYDPPAKDFVVADGLFIYFYDAELKEQSNAPIGQTLADFILRGDLKFSGDLTARNVKRGGGLLQITITQTADPDAGTLTLGFAENPMALKKWRVVDAQGLITEVELFYLKTGIAHPAGLFVYKNPEGGGKFNQ